MRRALFLVVPLCAALLAQGAWYWPFGSKEDDPAEPLRLHRLLEEANNYIEIAEDEALKGNGDAALENYRLALGELDRVERENPDRAETAEFSPLRNKRAACVAAMDAIRFAQVNDNERAVSVTDTRELQKKWNKKHGIKEEVKGEEGKVKGEEEKVKGEVAKGQKEVTDAKADKDEKAGKVAEVAKDEKAVKAEDAGKAAEVVKDEKAVKDTKAVKAEKAGRVAEVAKDEKAGKTAEVAKDEKAVKDEKAGKVAEVAKDEKVEKAEEVAGGDKVLKEPKVDKPVKDPTTDFKFRLKTALAEVRNRDYVVADLLLEELMQEKPNDLNVLLLRAAAQAGMDSNYAARRTLERAMRAHPKSYLPYYNLANLVLLMGEGVETARQYYEMGRMVGGPPSTALEKQLKGEK